MSLEKPLDNSDKGLSPAPPLWNTNRVLEPEGSKAPHLSIEPNSFNKLVLLSILVQRCLMLQWAVVKASGLTKWNQVTGAGEMGQWEKHLLL